MRSHKLPILLYGIVVYAVFLPTFLYLVGFVSGLFVPKHVDTALAGDASLGRALLINGALIAAFAVQHMIMARRWFKARWTRLVPPAAERSSFVLITCGLLVLLFTQWQAMPGVLWHVDQPLLRGVLTGVSLLGWGGVLVSTFLIDHFELFGLKQVIRHFMGRAHQAPPFLVRSFYKHTRHPLYLSFLIAFWVTPTMTVGHLVFAGLFTSFILVAVRLEERDLVSEHGDAYRSYQRDVPMILPALRPAATPSSGALNAG